MGGNFTENLLQICRRDAARKNCENQSPFDGVTSRSADDIVALKSRCGQFTLSATPCIMAAAAASLNIALSHRLMMAFGGQRYMYN